MGRPSVEGEPTDCLECRMIGSGAMLCISGYFAYLSHSAMLKASTGERRFSAVMSVGFAIASATRWFL